VTIDSALARRRQRAVLVITGTALVLLASIVVASGVGAVRLGPGQVFDGLFDRGDVFARQVVWQIRFPRVLVAAFVGMNLGIAGCILQAITRNPLGDPHVLGFSAGAGLASVALLTLASGYPVHLVPFAAFAGSLLSAGLVFALAWRGGISPVRFALAGVAVAALFTALSTAVIATSDLFTQATLSFLAGGLYQRGWEDVQVIAPYTIVAGLTAIVVADSLNLLALGDGVARGLGMRVERTRLLLAALAAVLTGAAVAVSGLLAFVGLVAPHTARLLVGSDQRYVVPLAALLGALLLVVADAVARVVIAPSEIPVGILTAVIGAPVLLLLIRTRT
jgi:iron complex transport system permease protein